MDTVVGPLMVGAATKLLPKAYLKCKKPGKSVRMVTGCLASAEALSVDQGLKGVGKVKKEALCPFSCIDIVPTIYLGTVMAGILPARSQRRICVPNGKLFVPAIYDFVVPAGTSVHCYLLKERDGKQK